MFVVSPNEGVTDKTEGVFVRRRKLMKEVHCRENTIVKHRDHICGLCGIGTA